MSNRSPLMIRKRGAKVNPRQKKILLQFMADNPLIFTRKITSDFTIEHHKAFWQNMGAVLNIFGPPRKTVDSWKKAWKDIKLRYRKAGIDIKEVIGTLKCENVVDTQMLLERADQIHTSTKGKVDIEQALRESILTEGDSSDFFITDMDVPQDGKPHNEVCNVKLEMNDAIFALESDNEDSTNESALAMKNEKAENSGEDLCEVAYEEVLETDLDGFHDPYSLASQPNSSILKRKLDSASGQNGIILTDDSDSDIDVSKNDLAKKSKLNNSSNSVSKLVSASNCDSKEKSQKNEAGPSILNELLLELRQHNKIQNEKLALKKKHFEQKKRLLEQSLVAKKDIARAHNILAKSIKTFVDNISFNT